MSHLKLVDPAPAASNEETGAGDGGVAMTTNIKIRFKKGAVFFAAGGSSPIGGNKVTTKLAIRLSPGGGSKRKAVEEAVDVTDEHAVKRIKTSEAALDVVAESSETATRTINRAASPVHSISTNTTATVQATPPPQRGPIQAASIYRKLARKLADQPLLLEDLKAYRTALTLQRRDDVKNIVSLRTALNAATRDATRKDDRVAEELRAMQDMIAFWTDGCNAEFERAELIKERVRGFGDDIEALMRAEVVSEASAGFSMNRNIELGLQKIMAQMNDVVGGVGLESEQHRMEGPADNLEI